MAGQGVSGHFFDYCGKNLTETGLTALA